MINGRGCSCDSMNFCSLKSSKAIYPGCQDSGNSGRAAIARLESCSFPANSRMRFLLPPHLNGGGKPGPPCLAGESALLQPDKYSRLDSLASSTETLVAICQLFALTCSHRCLSTHSFFRGGNARSSNNPLICSVARRSIRRTERGRSQSWKLPYASSLNCERCLKKKKKRLSSQIKNHS